jgi:hypothetical protein
MTNADSRSLLALPLALAVARAGAPARVAPTTLPAGAAIQTRSRSRAQPQGWSRVSRSARRRSNWEMPATRLLSPGERRARR